MGRKKVLAKCFVALLCAVVIILSALPLIGCAKQPVPDATTPQTTDRTVKNVIFMIADGGGYDNFTLASLVKEEMLRRGVCKLSGAKTEVTNDRLSDLGLSAVNKLYLDSFLVGSANTLLQTPHGAENDYLSYITDSAAAGTALATGYKTCYSYIGLDADGKPRASLSELSRMGGMATGIVTTKSYMDATPQTFFTSHSLHRYQYQDNSLQSLLSGTDVVIGEGTEFGDLYKTDTSCHPDITPNTLGYTVAWNKIELLDAAKTATKLWAPILGADNSTKEIKTASRDQAADHISYDIDGADSDQQPSLLEMTQAALQVLENINDPDGFFLMVEGGALDNAAEDGFLRAAVGEYLAFDEAFGYCVSWAQKRGDTIVIAVPDHDSGGFAGIEPCLDTLIDSIITGKLGSDDFTSQTDFYAMKTLLDSMGADVSQMTLHGDHTDMAVPISLYAPESVRMELLAFLTLPTDTADVRLGTNAFYVPNESNFLTWYASSALNEDYTIDNTLIAPAIAQILQLGSLDDATEQLFIPIGHTDGKTFTGSFGGSMEYGDKVFANPLAQFRYNTYCSEDLEIRIHRNTNTYEQNGTVAENQHIGNHLPISIFVLDNTQKPKAGTFYVPHSLAELLKSH